MGTLNILARATLGLALTATGPLTANPASAQPNRADSDPVESSQWGVIGRNTIGEPTAAVRGGPQARRTSSSVSANVPPPYGLGSLGIIAQDRKRPVPRSEPAF